MGSLGVRTGSPADTAAFGNEVDFVGDPLTDLTTVSYSVYTTGENNALSPENAPSVTFEVDPTRAGGRHGAQLLESGLRADRPGGGRVDGARCEHRRPLVPDGRRGHVVRPDD
jgi:hypothetical protein